MYKNRFPESINLKSIQQFAEVFSIQFFNGIVAFQISPQSCVLPQILRNTQGHGSADFRANGKNMALVEWPDVLTGKKVEVLGMGSDTNKIPK